MEQEMIKATVLGQVMSDKVKQHTVNTSTGLNLLYWKKETREGKGKEKQPHDQSYELSESKNRHNCLGTDDKFKLHGEKKWHYQVTPTKDKSPSLTAATVTICHATRASASQLSPAV